MGQWQQRATKGKSLSHGENIVLMDLSINIKYSYLMNMGLGSAEEDFRTKGLVGFRACSNSCRSAVSRRPPLPAGMRMNNSLEAVHGDFSSTQQAEGWLTAWEP